MQLEGLQSVTAAPAVEQAQPAQRQSQPAREAAEERQGLAYDRYTPENPQEHQPIGLYSVAREEDGSLQVRFDQPAEKQAAAPVPEQAEDAAPAGGPKENSKADDKEARCTTNTDRVDREIEQLREEQRQLQQQLRAAADSPQAASLEQRLTQVERELQQKDNDAYRRQHAVIS